VSILGHHDIIAVQFNSGGETATLERASTLKNAYVSRAKAAFTIWTRLPAIGWEGEQMPLGTQVS
jgi:hypothetical protein